MDGTIWSLGVWLANVWGANVWLETASLSGTGVWGQSFLARADWARLLDVEPLDAKLGHDPDA